MQFLETIYSATKETITFVLETKETIQMKCKLHFLGKMWFAEVFTQNAKC